MARKTFKQYDGCNVTLGTNGYEYIRFNKKQIRFHLYLWRKFYGEIPQGFHVHHKNFNPTDNRLENLELLTPIDHMRTHAGYIKENGEWVAKKCNLCEKILPLDNFYKHKNGHISSTCKPCDTILTNNWREKNPEKIKKEKENFYKNHPTRKAEENKKRYEKHKKVMLQRMKEYYQKNKEKIIQNNKDYRDRIKTAQKAAGT